MKRFISLTLLLALFSLAAATPAQEKSALQAMVDTERAFAKMSEDQGVRPAFMAFIADDGILFRPTAVKGKQWMTEHPMPPSDQQPLLSWYPAIAGMARAGDLGYTSGPWEYRSDSHDAKAVAWGHFLTVWKKQADGEWKFAIDLGISNSQPDQAEAQWQLPATYKTPQPLRGRFTDNAAALLARDREFSQASVKRGARAAFAAYALPEVRLYREGKFPLWGKDLAPAVLPDGPVCGPGSRRPATFQPQTISATPTAVIKSPAMVRRQWSASPETTFASGEKTAAPGKCCLTLPIQFHHQRTRFGVRRQRRRFGFAGVLAHLDPKRRRAALATALQMNCRRSKFTPPGKGSWPGSREYYGV